MHGSASSRILSDDTSNERVGWLELLTREHLPSLLLICLGVWLHAADSMLVATMMPAIVAEIGGQTLVGWSIALYEIGSIVAGAASGVLALRYGVRPPMAFAAILFAAGCVLSALAPAMWVVLTGRLLQGLGGGGLVAISFVAAGVLFPPRLMPRALATVSLLWGSSAFLGPLIGGLFVEFSTWRGGFAFFAAQALLLALWLWFFANPHKQVTSEKVGNIAATRLSLLALAVLAVAYAGVEIDLLCTGVTVLAGLLLLLLFFIIDSRAGDNRMLPRDAIRPNTVTGSALAMILCIAIATVSLTAYGPLLVVMLHGTSALVAGYIAACSSIGWSLAAVAVSGLPPRHDLKIIAIGMCGIAISVAGFLYSVPNGPIPLIAFFAALDGAGFGMAWVFILRQLVACAEPAERERVSAAMPTIQRLGYALGAALIGIVANATGFSENMNSEDARRAAIAIYLACIPFAGLGLLAMVRFTTLARRHNAQHAMGR